MPLASQGGAISELSRFLALHSARIAIPSLIAVVFLWSGTAKFRRPNESARALGHFGLRALAVPVVGTLFSLFEFATGSLIVIGLALSDPALWTGLIVATALQLGYAVGIANALVHSRSFDCECFGALSSEISSRTLIRSALFLCVSGGALWQVATSGAYHSVVGSDLLMGLVSGLGLCAIVILLSEVAPLARYRDPYAFEDTRMSRLN